MQYASILTLQYFHCYKLKQFKKKRKILQTGTNLVFYLFCNFSHHDNLTYHSTKILFVLKSRLYILKFISYLLYFPTSN